MYIHDNVNDKGEYQFTLPSIRYIVQQARRKPQLEKSRRVLESLPKYILEDLDNPAYDSYTFRGDEMVCIYLST